MMAGTNGDTEGIEGLGNIVWMHAVQRERHHGIAVL